MRDFGGYSPRNRAHEPEAPPTADVCDRFGSAARVLDLPLRMFGRRRRFDGPVRTVRCHCDVGLVGQLLDDPGTGSVLVVDGGGSHRSALLGEREALIAAGQGWGEVIVDGADGVVVLG